MLLRSLNFDFRLNINQWYLVTNFMNLTVIFASIDTHLIIFGKGLKIPTIVDSLRYPTSKRINRPMPCLSWSLFVGFVGLVKAVD